MRGLPFAACVVAAIACSPVTGIDDNDGGDDDDDDDNIQIDAAVTDDDGGNTPNDAGAEPQVRVEVYDDKDEPVRGLRVYFHNADGLPIGSAVTGASGAATFEIPSDAMVTVGLVSPDQDRTRYNVQTIIGIQPGEVIRIGPRQRTPSWDYRGDIQLNLPFMAGALGYTVEVGCDHVNLPATNTNGAIAIYDNDCTGGIDPVSLLAFAEGSGGQAIGYTFATDVAVGGTANFPTWFNSWDQISVDFTNVPAAAVFAEASFEFVRRKVAFPEFAPPRKYDLGGTTTTIHDVVMAPSGFSTSLIGELQVGFASGGSPANVDGFAFAIHHIGSPVNEFELDLRDELLPRVRNVIVEPQGDGRYLAKFDTIALLQDADAGAVALAWERQEGGTTTEWQWLVLFPPEASSPITLPQLAEEVVFVPGTDEPAWPPPRRSATIAGNRRIHSRVLY